MSEVMAAAPEAATQNPIAISIQGLTKTFDGVTAVAGIDLDVPRGSFFGLVGPNGAGKSTTLAMVTGLLRPDHGTVAIAGRQTWADPVSVKQIIGVLPEDLRLFERLSGAEMLHYTGRLRGLDQALIDRRSHDLLDVLGLTPAADKLVTDYSQGMRKKIGLAVALLHAPDVLFLDEPFESVDPLSVRTIRTVLSSYTASGATIVFSSHVMPLVEELCDRVAIMHAGHIVAAGPTAEVQAGHRLEDRFVELVGATETDPTALGWLREAIH